MKRVNFLILFIFCLTGLTGCTKGVESCPAEPSNAESVQTIITSDMLGQGVYDTLEEEWAAWNKKDETERMLSSHIPGICYKNFDTLEECEEFLGFGMDSPLEDSDFEKASFVGMPEGHNDAPRFYVSFYGEATEQVQWISVDSGYRDGDIRITVNAQVYVDTALEAPETQELSITEDSGGQFVANSVTIIQGPVIYNIRVIGDPNHKEEVKETLQKVMECFTLSF